MEARNEGQMKLPLGGLLSGDEVRAAIIGAYNHHLPASLQVDNQCFSTIFVGGKAELLGTNGRNLEDMLPETEPHPHFVRVDVPCCGDGTNQIFYSPEDAKYKVY